ncbi:MAG: 4-hydroxy-tetrahydrodipicolinate reductase [Clostridia bacterium]|nr:4-hydroxy-tetrahydrodipicolinate reductase [Clostridia bacterium]
MLKIGVSGLGRTGLEIARFLLNQPDIKLVCGFCSPNSSKRGRDLGELLGLSQLNIPIIHPQEIELLEEKPQVVIDFSPHEAALENAPLFYEHKINLVMASTGFHDLELKKLKNITLKYNRGIVIAPNITKGVNVLMLLSQIAADILNSYDIEIIEQHHNKKVDIPSGTAIKLANSLPREAQVHAVRAGGIIGVHKTMLVGQYDKIEISHESFSRTAFAEGALTAAKFIHNKSGIFEMNHVLDLNNILSKYLIEVSDSTAV